MMTPYMTSYSGIGCPNCGTELSDAYMLGFSYLCPNCNREYNLGWYGELIEDRKSIAKRKYPIKSKGIQNHDHQPDPEDKRGDERGGDGYEFISPHRLSELIQETEGDVQLALKTLQRLRAQAQGEEDDMRFDGVSYDTKRVEDLDKKMQAASPPSEADNPDWAFTPEFKKKMETAFQQIKNGEYDSFDSFTELMRDLECRKKPPPTEDDEPIDFGVDYAVESEPYDEEKAEAFHKKLYPPPSEADNPDWAFTPEFEKKMETAFQQIKNGEYDSFDSFTELVRDLECRKKPPPIKAGDVRLSQLADSILIMCRRSRYRLLGFSAADFKRDILDILYTHLKPIKT